MMRKNQKGFTLVELIIAIAILAIVTLAVCGFIVVGSKSYTSANTDILLQQEAQLALNQISDVIIDTTDSISYSVGTSSSLQNVLKDSEYGGEATDKCLVVVNRNDTSSNNDNPSYWFYWNKDEEKIHFSEVNVDSTMSADVIQAGFNSAASTKAVLAEHVTDLNIDISQFEENRVVMISMTLKNGNREYYTSNNVTVRNRIALNVVDIDPMKRADEFRIENIRSVVLEPGDNYTFIPTVDSTSDDKALEWVHVSGDANGTTTSQNGDNFSIHVGINEVRENLTLRVTRLNEEYAGQKDRVAETVQVKIKRVNSVNLTASASTVKKGETVEITGKAVGWLLKTKCDSDLCASDNINKDEDLNPAKDVVTGWHFVEGSGTIESSDEGKAVIKIDQNMAGNTVTIEATSTLSATKNGGYSSGADTNSSVAGVQGRISFTVEEGMEAIPSLGDLRYGSDNDGNIGMIYDFLYSEAGLSDYDHYVVCARLREVGNNNKDQDQVILYFRSDKNIRFTPDIFGADLHKDYNVYLQLLLPVDRALYQYNGKANNGKSANQFQGTQDDNSYYNTQTLIDEYFNNLDSNGSYTGSKYEKTGQFFGSIGKPVIHFTCDGKAYPNTDPNAVTKYSLAGGYDSEAILGAAYMDKDATVNIDLKSMNRLEEVMFTVYKGEGEDINKWTYVAGYNPDTGAFDGSFMGGMFSVSASGGKDSLLTDSTYLVKKNNSSGSWDNASGTYRVVLGYRFACDKNARGDYRILAERNVNGDYNVNYYSNPEGSIKLVIESGFNLEVKSRDGNWKTYFPVPTDGKFPFALKNSTKQSTTWNFTKYNDAGQKIGDLNNVKVECEYFSSDNSYTITLSTDSIDGKTVTTHTYGKYKCKYGGDKWELQSGESDKTETIVTNIFDISGSGWEAYFPTPADSDFPFKKESSQTQTIRQQLTLFGQWYSYSIPVEITCVYDNGTYTISIKEKYDWGVQNDFGEWAWKNGGTKWTKK